MAEFIAKNKYAEVKSDFLTNIIEVMEIGKDFRKKLLEDRGIDFEKDKAEGNWINLQKSLDIYKDIKEKIGERTLYMIGVLSMDNKSLIADSLEAALNSINALYISVHRGHDIGEWNLVSFSLEDSKAVITSNTPYPSQLERGMLMSILRRLRPTKSTNYNVLLDLDLESRERGGDSCTYILHW